MLFYHLLLYHAAQVFIFRHPVFGLLPALFATAMVAFANALVWLPITRNIVRQLGPKAGDGPPVSVMDNSFFEVSLCLICWSYMLRTLQDTVVAIYLFVRAQLAGLPVSSQSAVSVMDNSFFEVINATLVCQKIA